MQIDTREVSMYCLELQYLAGCPWQPLCPSGMFVRENTDTLMSGTKIFSRKGMFKRSVWSIEDGFVTLPEVFFCQDRLDLRTCRTLWRQFLTSSDAGATWLRAAHQLLEC